MALLPFASLTRYVGWIMLAPLVINIVLLFRFNFGSSMIQVSFSDMPPYLGGDDADSSPRQSVHFRPFNTTRPDLHNTTVHHQTIPGLFANDHLFFLGARLTPHYDERQDVHIDLFGFPGDWFTRYHHLSEGPACTSTNTSKYGRMFHYFMVEKRVTLYCQVECDNDKFCGDPIPMELIPLRSVDFNQNDTTLIWRCNVTDHVTKGDLRQAAASDANRALRTSFLMKYSRTKEASHPWSTPKEVALVDIPLRTGVVGHAGPQIRTSDGNNSIATQSYLTQPNIDVGLCVDVYGLDTQKYLPEFVQHHKNVGVEQILVGVETTLDSAEMHAMEELLEPYIQEGFVVLAATGVRDYFDCYFDFHKLHFYHQCLYHYKGFAKYSATWDVDEYWLPPDKLEITGRHKERHRHEGGEPSIRKDSSETKFVMRSEPSAFSPLVESDKWWRESRYAKSVSIKDVMSAVDQYHIHNGCGNQWCYHLFPSLTTHLRIEMHDGGVLRTHQQIYDFLKRDEDWNHIWRKAVSNTKYTTSSGIHTPGSCRFDGDKSFFYLSKEETCLPHLFDPDVYGSIHHFISMMLPRYDCAMHNKTHLPLDEYVQTFGRTVNRQLRDIYGDVSARTWKRPKRPSKRHPTGASR